MVLKENPIKLVIVGAKGHAREILWTINECNIKSKKYRVLGFIDDDKSLWKKSFDGIPVLGGLDWFSELKDDDIHCVVGIGDSKIRKKIVKNLEKRNIPFVTLIHPSVLYTDSVTFEEGTVIQAGSIITVDTKIGRHVLINMNCVIAHECKIEDFVTINPGAHVNGNSTIGEGSYIGTGVTMKQQIKIGKWSVIGAGTTLIDDVPDYSLYVGVPGKLKKKYKVFN